MGLFPAWLKEFPGAFIDTYKKAIPENWEEFKQEVGVGAKAVLQVPGKIAAEIIKPIHRPLILIATVAIVILILWRTLIKKGIA